MKRIIIDSGINFIMGASAYDYELIELIIEDRSKPSIVGNIYAGIIKNILPSRFAFVDIGEDRNAFLYLNDAKESALDIKNGAQVIVQAAKDATGSKGPAVTSCLSFTGKYLVLIKNNFIKEEIGVSKKIEDADERERLKNTAKKMLKHGYGLIVRTAAEGVLEEELQTEYDRLEKECVKIVEHGGYTKPPAVIYKEESISVKIVKELMTKDVAEIIVNDESHKNEISEYITKNKIEIPVIYKDEPVMESYFLTKQIDNALNKKVWLDSGGFLCIEQTEACVVIDVNTGKFSGKKDHMQTVSLINSEAAVEIVKQIQLRNLSGIIIVDFIDMKSENETQKLKKLMEAELLKSRISASLAWMTDSGFMQITRKKIREPVSALLQEDCPCCKGTGKIIRKGMSK